jgi:hypothetical protein
MDFAGVCGCVCGDLFSAELVVVAAEDFLEDLRGGNAGVLRFAQG